jgi:hypothetical protein
VKGARRETAGDTAVIALHGPLDDATARELLRSVVLHAGRSALPLEIDLRAMDGWTPGGLRGLGACAPYCVRFRLGPNLGRPTP